MNGGSAMSQSWIPHFKHPNGFNFLLILVAIIAVLVILSTRVYPHLGQQAMRVGGGLARRFAKWVRSSEAPTLPRFLSLMLFIFVSLFVCLSFTEFEARNNFELIIKDLIKTKRDEMASIVEDNIKSTSDKIQLAGFDKMVRTSFIHDIESRIIVYQEKLRRLKDLQIAGTDIASKTLKQIEADLYNYNSARDTVRVTIQDGKALVDSLAEIASARVSDGEKNFAPANLPEISSDCRLYGDRANYSNTNLPW